MQDKLHGLALKSAVGDEDALGADDIKAEGDLDSDLAYRENTNKVSIHN